MNLGSFNSYFKVYVHKIKKKLGPFKRAYHYNSLFYEHV